MVKGWPVVGALPRLLHEQLDFLPAARRKYGEVYELDLGVVKLLVLNNPEHAQHVLRKNVRNYRKNGQFWEFIQDFVGNTLPVREGDFWLHYRRMLQPHFHLKQMADMIDLMSKGIEEEIAGWDAAAGQPFDLAKALYAVALKSTTIAIFGARIDPELVTRAAQAMVHASSGMGRAHYLTRRMLSWSLRKWLPVPERYIAQRMRQEVDQLLHTIITRHRDTIREDPTMLSVLLNVVEEETGEHLSDRQVCDEALIFFAAGFETTTNAMSWAMHLLMEHPDVMARARAEADAVLSDGTLSFDKLKQLEYHRRVFQEAMRLLPPAWFMPRTAIRNDFIDGYFVPAGTVVLLPIYMYHHHPDHWDEPETFDPDRFTAERSKSRHKCAWMPFGAGQRLCIGKDLAMAQSQMILASALRRYDLAPVDGHHNSPKFAFILKPKSNVRANITRR
jgi:cytochrome P450